MLPSVNCAPQGWSSGQWGQMPWASESFTPGGPLPSAPPFSIYCVGPCGPMQSILSYVGVTNFGSSGQIYTDVLTNDLVITSGGGAAITDAGISIALPAIPSSWTIDFTINFLNLPVDFSNLVNDHIFIGQQAAPPGSVVGLFFSQAGIGYSPCVHMSGGNIVAESIPTILPGSQFLVSQNDYWTIRIAVSAVTNLVYVYITRTADLGTLGYQLRYEIGRTASSSCVTTPPNQTLISVRGTSGSQSTMLLDSLCLGPGLIVPNSCSAFSTVLAQKLGQWGLGNWGVEVWGGEGSELLVVDGGGIPSITSFVPPLGTTDGGDPFVIQGTNIATKFFNDQFNEGALDLAFWTPLGPTPLVIGVGPSGVCKCATGVVPGSYSGLQSVLLTPTGDFHVQIDYSVQNAFLSLQPSGEVTLASLEAKLDDGNFARISLLVRGPTALTGILRCEVWQGAIVQHFQETPFSNTVGTLGLMRYFDPVRGSDHAVFWLNGSKVFDTFDMISSQVSIRIFAYNEHSPYNVQTWFRNFISHSTIVLVGNSGTDVATNVVEVTDSYVRGLTPPTVNEWSGLVSVRLTNGIGSCCSAIFDDCFTYEFPEDYVVGRSEPFRPTRRECSITTDPILRNPGPNIGLGLRRQS